MSDDYRKSYLQNFLKFGYVSKIQKSCITKIQSLKKNYLRKHEKIIAKIGAASMEKSTRHEHDLRMRVICSV